MPSPRPLRVAVAWVSRTRAFRQLGPRIMPPLERAASAITRGRTPLSGAIVPSLVLHTTGATSGLERETPLMYVPEADGRMLVAGSNFGRDRHPAWTANLLANPRAAVTVHGRRIPVRASPLADAEREAAWVRLEEQWPGFRGYERASGRVIRIFRLTPEDGSVDPDRMSGSAGR